jgi:dTDP-4-amino-4,6-dideoxygalactose transaminase
MNNFKTWPLGDLPDKFQRPEIEWLKRQGYSFNDYYDIVEIFEQKVAKFAGSQYAVAVDSCTNGLFLCLKYSQAQGTITIPTRTYVSLPMQILHAGCQVAFEEIAWSGIYQLKPYNIWDGATRWRQNMYQDGLHVVSFQIKKRIPIGRGGMILTDDYEAYKWLKQASHDGRNLKLTHNLDNVEMLGWHYYMTPEDAARGILLMDQTPLINNDSSTDQSYNDLSTLAVFK